MKKIYYAGFFNGRYGYSEAAKGYKEVLSKNNDIKFINLDEINKAKQILNETDFSDSTLILHKRPKPNDFNISINTNIRKAKELIYFTVWECSKIPHQWRDEISKANTIVTPSTYAQNSFKSSIVNKNKKFHVLPHILKKFDEKTKYSIKEIPNDKINILVIASQLTERKGIDLAVRGFYSLPINLRNKSRLIVKGTKQTAKYIQSSLLPRKNKPEVCCIEEYLDDKQMDDLLMSSDMLLSPNRGEGYGIDIVRSIYANIPVVATGTGGYMDIVNDRNSSNFSSIQYEMDYAVSVSTFHDLDTYGLLWPCPYIYNVTDALKKQLESILTDPYEKDNISTINKRIKDHNENVEKILNNILYEKQ